MQTDQTFITNEKGQTLRDRFAFLIKDTQFFDVLSGYFYSSGFHVIYKSLEKSEKIRILIGISTNRHTYELIQEARSNSQQSLQFSHAESKEYFSDAVAHEMEDSEDNNKIEDGVRKFIEWMRSGKLEIKAYPSDRIHAKLYIMTFKKGDRDIGRVITGSSNFTQAGLQGNLEFNVELKNRSDYDFAKKKFEVLWKDAVDVSEQYIETIEKRTWLNDTITPHDLYLKFLYEYFKDQLTRTDEVFYKYLPIEFKKLSYQEQAVLNAKKILDEYGGVFLSDVVGLGKTYMATMLADQLDGRHLVIAPPTLLEKDNPGSWRNVFSDFRVAADFESLGKLESIVRRGVEKYSNIFIDEAHRFRTETNVTYEKLAEVCKGKRVILVTATPLNNYPKDILSQIKLFQKGRKSTIPGVADLEGFFTGLEKRVKNLDRRKDYERYMSTVQNNARDIREKVLKHIMVRRTRKDVENYFSQDLASQKIKFPEVEKPEPVFYQLNEDENAVFIRTIELITNQFTFARYMPMVYYIGKERVDVEKQGQRNMARFMKILFVKRLESSFFAFRNTLKRFINTYEQFITQFDKGMVYVSKKHVNQIFELLDGDDDEAVQELIDSDKAQKYESEDFDEKFMEDLRNDLDILKEIQELWETIRRDPKLLTFIDILKKKKVLKENKIIVFTESKETAEYLEKNLRASFGDCILLFSGASGAATRDKVIDNFDARARNKKDEYRILVATEVLAEGVNLHQSNVVVNYDIPWNPTRLMQRVGRINRVDTLFDRIYTFNFFPTEQSNSQIKLRESAEAKIKAFIEMLGTDARLLTEGEEIKSYDLFERLVSQKTITGEDEGGESELKYLQVIKQIRDTDIKLFERVKHLPKKARTARSQKENSGNQLLTYFRKGSLQKFFATKENSNTEELDFMSAAQILEANPQTERKSIPKAYHAMLEKNKDAFRFTTTEEAEEVQPRKGRDNFFRLLGILKAIKGYGGFTDEQDEYLDKVMLGLEDGDLPKNTVKRTLKAFSEAEGLLNNPLQAIGLLQTHVSSNLLKEHVGSSAAKTAGPREVILSEYLASKK